MTQQEQQRTVTPLALFQMGPQQVEQVSHLGVTTGVGCSAGETPVRCDVGATLASNGAHDMVLWEVGE